MGHGVARGSYGTDGGSCPSPSTGSTASAGARVMFCVPLRLSLLSVLSTPDVGEEARFDDSAVLGQHVLTMLLCQSPGRQLVHQRDEHALGACCASARRSATATAASAPFAFAAALAPAFFVLVAAVRPLGVLASHS